MISVLYIDDEPSLLELGRIYLEGLRGFEVRTATSAKEGLRLLKERPFDAIISDYLMPEMDGIGLLKKVRASHGDIPFILFTGKGREEVVIDAINNGADFYLQKGGNPKAQFAELAHKLRQAVNRHRTEQALQMKTEETDRFFSLTLDMLCIADMESRFLFVNRAWERVLGYSVKDLESSKFLDLVHPDDMERTKTAMEQLEGGQQVIDFTNRYRTKNGDYRWIEWRSAPFEGRLIYAAARDVTERKMAEEALVRKNLELNLAYEALSRKEEELRRNFIKLSASEQDIQASEARYRRLVEQTFYAIITHRDNKIVFANEAAAKLAGAESAKDMVGREIDEFSPPGSEELIRETVQRLYENPGLVEPFIEQSFRRFDGKIIETEVMATSYVEDGRPTVQVVFRDVTERNRIQRELMESEENFRRLVENVPDAIYIVVKERIQYLNPAAVRLFGAGSAGELLGSSVFTRIEPRFHQAIRERIHRTTVERKPVEKLDEVYVRLDGTPLDVEVAAVPFYYQKENGALVILRDITDRKRAEERLLAINQELKEGEEKFHELFELGGEAVVLIDSENGRMLECNSAMSEMYGYSHEELLLMRNTEISAEPERTRAATMDVKPGSVVVPIRYHRRKDGSVFPVEINARFFTWKGRGVVVAAIRDITERKRAEDALREIYSKLSLLNSITRHDILNKLAVLQMNLELAREKSNDRTMAGFIERLDRAVRGIREHVEFSRIYQDLGLQEPMWQPIGKMVSAMEVPPGLTLRSDIGDLEIFADPMLTKVFYNLLDNSVRHGVKCTKVTVSLSESKDGTTIVWEDDGVGIPATEKEKIFQHGYGKNTGLGLFISREILAITRISIKETGEEGVGARFEINIPKGAYRFKAT